MDARLEHILQQVKLLCEQNPEFKEKLGELFPSTKHIYSSDDRVDRIEKYLGLDYMLDKKDPSIDYSFVTNSEVRDKLETDNREMHRYRHGTRYHKVDFKEFCRYALLQAEMLLNYYYDSITDNFSDVKSLIMVYNKSAKIENCTSLVSIPFNCKLWAFKNQFGLSINMMEWDNIRDVRNCLSHRSPKEEVEILSYKQKLLDADFPLKADGTVNYSQLKENKDKFEREYNKTKEYKDYCFLIWLSKCPFESVMLMLANLANDIRLQLIAKE